MYCEGLAYTVVELLSPTVCHLQAAGPGEQVV